VAGLAPAGVLPGVEGQMVAVALLGVVAGGVVQVLAVVGARGAANLGLSMRRD
jgi:hypothetical protein